MVIVLLPFVSVILVLNAPSEPTVTAVPLALSVTGDDVASFVVPDTVSVALLVIRPSAGDVTESAGGTVSTLNVTVLADAALPS